MTLQAAYVHAMWEHTNLDDTEEVQTLFFIAKDIVKGTRAVDDFFLALDCLLCVQKAIQGGSPHSTRDLSRIYHEIYHVYHGFITKIITLWRAHGRSWSCVCGGRCCDDISLISPCVLR